jgi:transcription elongation factor Elf1
LRNFLAEDFACPKCSSQSVVYPTIINDDEYVTCRGCGAILATLGQFRRLIARHLLPPGSPISGC